MAIISLFRDTTGTVGIKPNLVYLMTDNTLAEVTTAGYITRGSYNGIYLQPTDQVLAYTTDMGNQWLYPTFSNGVVTLNAQVSGGGVLLPVVNAHVPVFNGTTGQIEDSGLALATPVGTATSITISTGALVNNHVAQLDGTNGAIKDGGVLGTATAKAASDNTKATLASIDAAPTAGRFSLFTDTAGTIGQDSRAANLYLYTSLANPDQNINLISTLTTVTAAALASGASIIMLTGSGTKQYIIRSLIMSATATPFSGGGGDRLLAVGDGATTYTTIAAAALGAGNNLQWGNTNFNYPAAPTSMLTPTAAGANIVAKYSGGTADYSTGTVTISMIAQRVA